MHYRADTDAQGTSTRHRKATETRLHCRAYSARRGNSEKKPLKRHDARRDLTDTLGSILIGACSAREETAGGGGPARIRESLGGFFHDW